MKGCLYCGNLVEKQGVACPQRPHGSCQFSGLKLSEAELLAECERIDAENQP